MGMHDGVRAALKSKAKEMNSLAAERSKQYVEALKKWEAATASAKSIAAEWQKMQSSLTGGEKIWEEYSVAQGEEKARVREKYAAHKVWLDQMVKIGKKYEAASNLRGDLDKEKTNLNREAKEARERETKAIQALSDYVENKKKMKKGNELEYQEYKKQYMELADSI